MEYFPQISQAQATLDTRKDCLTIAQSVILPENYYSHLVPSEPIVLTKLSVVITGKIAVVNILF